LPFTLLEPTNYSIAGSFNGFLSPPNNSNEVQAVDMGVQLTRFSPFVVPFLELGVERNRTGGTVNLEFDDSSLVTTSQGLTGVLGPGDYRFSFGVHISIGSNTNIVVAPGTVGNGTGQFEFSLDRVPPGRVPDAGSTLTLLSMALGSVAFMRRRSQSKLQRSVQTS
jgi:VPDSG-CTERM motif